MDFGYSTDRLSVMTIALPFDRYLRECNGPASPDDSAATEAVSRCTNQRVFGLHDRIESMFARMPAVAHASSILVQPFLGPSVFMTRVEADHQGQTEGDANPWVAFEAVGPDFFETMGLPLVQGRPFTAADRDGAAGLAIITQGVARALWPGEDALGRRYRPRGNTDPSAEVTIIGIVPDVHYRQHRVTTPTIYRPYRQMMAQGTFIVRTRGSLRTTLPGIQAGLHDIDSALDVSKAETMDELIAPELAEPRLEALLLAAFAITAVVLAAIGLYGIMAQTVAQRHRELGVRMVLGATAAELRTMMLRQAAIITAIGGVAGLAGALAGSRMLSAVLFRVSPTDPATLLGISLLLAAVALLAAWIPARRATRIDPASALRSQWTNAHHHR
jgi:predicted permease